MLDEDLLGLLNKAYFYLKFRPRTITEIRRYLYEKIRKTHWSTEAADKAIDHLLEIGLLDDKKFVDWFVDVRTTGKPKGVRLLKQELLRLGVDKDLIDEYFSQHSIDEEKLAEKVLVKRWPRFKNLPPEKRFQKASQFLLRRGFGYEIAKKTIKKAL